ncbi:MAG: hypothetical protein NC321_15910, partial [Clostridium sp.]|nr:hypothetical protein [Clostridium sp.]
MQLRKTECRTGRSRTGIHSVFRNYTATAVKRDEAKRSRAGMAREASGGMAREASGHGEGSER